jgi:hypothetical protein
MQLPLPSLLLLLLLAEGDIYMCRILSSFTRMLLGGIRCAQLTSSHSAAAMKQAALLHTTGAAVATAVAAFTWKENRRFIM